MGGNPFMRALDMRVGSLWIGEDQTRDPERAAMQRSLLHGRESAEAVINGVAGDPNRGGGLGSGYGV